MPAKLLLTKSWKAKLLYSISFLLIVTGLNLTIFSSLGICTEACGDVHNYRYFGYSFEFVGFIFFTLFGLIHFLSYWYPRLSLIELMAVSGALGGEVAFILVQKYVIGHWCPICLSIASTIGLLGIITIINYFYFNRGSRMKSLWSGLSSLSIFFIGLVVSVVAVAKPVASFADSPQDPAFGNKESNIEIYVVTDWFCPACRAVEPNIEKMAPKIMKDARLFFIDMDIHPESLNYVPYNLSFMVNNKDNYFEIRKVLHTLATKTKKPSIKQVQQAVNGLGVTYEQLDFTDIDSGRRFFEGIIKNFKVTQTPTVVIANRKKLDAKKLVGSEITEANIMKAIKDLQ